MGGAGFEPPRYLCKRNQTRSLKSYNRATHL